MHTAYKNVTLIYPRICHPCTFACVLILLWLYFDIICKKVILYLFQDFKNFHRIHINEHTYIPNSMNNASTKGDTVCSKTEIINVERSRKTTWRTLSCFKS